MIKGIDIVSSEFEYVVGIFPSIESYIAGDLEDINDNTNYPNLLFNVPRANLNNSSVLSSGMPKRRSYNCRLLLSDTYYQSERETKTLTEKFEELETVLSQYLGKVYKRGRNSLSTISIDGIYACDYNHRAHHDDVITVGCDIVVHLILGNCDAGTFTDVISPSNLVSTINGSNIDLEWINNSDNEDGFYIYRSLSYSGIYSLIGTNGAGDNTFSDTTANSEILYFYKVSAFDGIIESAFSNVATGYIGGGGGSYTYNVLIDGVDTGEDVTIDGTDVTINLI
jgi:hypothetical protein